MCEFSLRLVVLWSHTAAISLVLVFTPGNWLPGKSGLSSSRAALIPYTGLWRWWQLSPWSLSIKVARTLSNPIFRSSRRRIFIRGKAYISLNGVQGITRASSIVKARGSLVLATSLFNLLLARMSTSGFLHFWQRFWEILGCRDHSRSKHWQLRKSTVNCPCQAWGQKDRAEMWISTLVPLWWFL